MDIDNSQADGTGSGGIDMEQSLLQQFSCMGTTDKDELIQQLQKLLGSQLNYNTAAFFLDMNNWNLQAAICSYFDVGSSTKLPSMCLISDPTASDHETVEPGTRFEKVWHIENFGAEPWPANCYLQCAQGPSMECGRKDLPPLEAGSNVYLTVHLISPTSPGVYQSKWRLCTPGGTYFGDPLWVIITVVEAETMALAQQLSRSHLSELNASRNDGSVPDNADTGMC